MNRLHSHCAVVRVCDAELVKGFPKESIARDGGDEVEGFSERCIAQLFLESYEPMSVESDFYR